tara:strand:+ start:254 stop:721 length:468 start_codon:yes stop_codon:yes gene_type:complete
MNLFLSTYSFKIDKKSRLSLPSSYRAILKEENKIEIVLFKSFKYKCIEGCSYRYIKDISKRIDQLDIFSDDQDDFSTSIFSELRPIKIDQEGRFILSEDLLKYSFIKNEVTFVGQGNSFQIWEPSRAKSRQENSRKRLLKNKKTLKSVITRGVSE